MNYVFRCNIMNLKYFLVSGKFIGQRIDWVLSKYLKISRNSTLNLIKNCLVTVNKKKVKKSMRLKKNSLVVIDNNKDNVLINNKLLKQRVQSKKKIQVLYEDSDLLFIDKPSEMAVHSSPGWNGPTVINNLYSNNKNIILSSITENSFGSHEQKGIVHRLDVGTSGVMVIAKTGYAYSILKKAFRLRNVKKIYHALVQGIPDPLTGIINNPIARKPGNDWRFTVVPKGGREAITKYEVIEVFGPIKLMGSASLVKIKLKTGRTHQIRVHFSSFNHPCLGDKVYGANPRFAKQFKLNRQWLHSRSIGLIHPRHGNFLNIKSNYSKDLQYVLDKMNMK